MSFKDIKGQDTPISILKRAIENNSVAHAYLFVGIDGIGKALTANTFAKALNCEKHTRGDCCDICASCRKIDNKNHPDIFRIAPEESQKAIRIASIRALEDRVSLRAYEAKRKVCIIEDGHLMTSEASNSLLKTLEEPPADSVFILTTSNIAALFRTIVSRCQVIKFSPLTSEIVESILIKKLGFRKETAKFISCLSGGGMDERMVLHGEEFIEWKNRIIDEFMDGSFFEEESMMFSSPKNEFRQVLSILINWYRDILIYKNGGDKNSIVNFDRTKEVVRLAGGLSYEDIEGRLNALLDGHLAAGQNVNQKLVIGTLI